MKHVMPNGGSSQSRRIMGNESWRLNELWEKHSKNNAGIRLMSYADFLEAMHEFILSIEWKPDERSEHIRSD